MANGSKNAKNIKIQPMAKRVENRKNKKINLFLLISAIVALLGVVIGAVVGVVSYLNNREIDYLNDNLGKYIYIAASDYKSFEVEDTLDDVTDRDVEMSIIKLLTQNKGAMENGGATKRWVEITPGDLIDLYYIGYTLDGDGNKVYFDGGCNLSKLLEERTQEEVEKDMVEVGSGSLLFEYELIGKKTVDYLSISAKTSGSTEANDILYVTYSYILSDGACEDARSEYIDLSSPFVDERFGEGFREFLTGVKIGEKIKEPSSQFISNGTDGQDVYFDITVNGAFRNTGSEGKTALTVETYFPMNYHSEEMRGVTAYFDIYVKGGIEYTETKLDENFITEVLKESEETLSSYEGQNILDKFRAKKRAELEVLRDEELATIIEDALWANLKDKVVIKEIPDFEIENCYNNYLSQFSADYENYYSSYYSNLDSYIRATLGIGSKEEWKPVLREQAEVGVVEKLLFYYVARAEGLYPSGDAYEEIYEDFVGGYLDSYLASLECSREDYKTEEEYLEAVAKYKEKMFSYYEEDYFEDNAYYIYVIDALSEYAVVVKK